MDTKEFEQPHAGKKRKPLPIVMARGPREYPWRAKLRGPSLVNLQILPQVVRGYRMGDVIAILGSLDLVLGEVDR